MIAIADYGLGNIRSVQKAFEFLSLDCCVTSDAEVIEKADGLVLPGVGAFDDAIKNLEKINMLDMIIKWIDSDRPFLGICLGFQMLFEYSEEGNSLKKGLGTFKGSVKKIPGAKGLKVPQIGWNTIDIKKEVPLLKDVNNGSHVYFVHSFYVDAKIREEVLTKTEYGIVFDSSVARGNIYATQFHPEKSGEVGLQIIKNFGDIVIQNKRR